MLKIFIEYSNDTDEIYKNIEEYSPNKNCKIFIVFDNMIADMLGNQKPNPIVTEYFYQRQKAKHFSCVYYTILFCWAKKYQTKFYALFYYENFTKTTTSTN